MSFVFSLPPENKLCPCHSTSPYLSSTVPPFPHTNRALQESRRSYALLVAQHQALGSDLLFPLPSPRVGICSSSRAPAMSDAGMCFKVALSWASSFSIQDTYRLTAGSTPELANARHSATANCGTKVPSWLDIEPQGSCKAKDARRAP